MHTVRVLFACLILLGLPRISLLGGSGDGVPPVEKLKPVMFDHGLPIVFRGGTRFLVLEFLVESPGEAVEKTGEEHRIHARYRYKVLEPAQADPVESGTGELVEHTEVVARGVNPDGRRWMRTRDLGSRTSIRAGDLGLWWSNSRSGRRSWVYFQARPRVHFVQQFKGATFEEIDGTFLKTIGEWSNLLASEEGEQAVHVFSPTVMDLSVRDLVRPVAIERLQRQGGDLVLHFQGLEAGRRYLLERSVTLGQGDWKPAGQFEADAVTAFWTTELDPDVPVQFYRIREAD